MTSSLGTIWSNDEMDNLLEEHTMAEEKLIGTLILCPDRIAESQNIIKKEDFNSENCKIAFDALIDLSLTEDPVDIVNLAKSLKVSLITDLMQNGGNSFEVNSLSKRIKENASLRLALSSSYYSIRNIIAKKSLIDSLKPIYDCIDTIEKNTIIPKQNNMNAIIAELEKERNQIKEKKMVGFPTWDNLDQLVYGLIVPHIWVIGGYPGTGKTFFMLQLAERILRHNARVSLFSTENSSMRNVLRLIGCHTGINEMDIFRDNISDNEKNRIKDTEQYLSQKSLYIYDDVFTTQEIKSKLHIQQKREKVDVVMIDYIQLLNYQEDNYEQMRHVASDLQRISKDMNCSIVAISQISNEGQKSKRFFQMNFKGAGEIGAIADVAIELKRSESDFNTLGAIVKKVRHGMPGTIKFSMFTEENKINNNYIQEIL